MEKKYYTQLEEKIRPHRKCKLLLSVKIWNDFYQLWNDAAFRFLMKIKLCHFTDFKILRLAVA